MADEGVLDELFGALAEPTRRRLFRTLVEDGPRTATELAAALPVTRQAVVKHLQALADAGLAEPRRTGREVRYVATPAALAEAVRWMLEASERWDARTERLVRAAQRR